MRRAAWLFVIAVFMGVAACGQSDDPSARPVIHEDVPAAEIPTLSADDIAEADQIIKDLPTALPDLDKTLLDLLTSLPPEEQGPWHAKDLRLIGVSRHVILPQPLTLGPVSLPDIAWDEATDDYKPFTFHYDSIVGLRTVTISIDLKLGRVVAIQPDEAKKVTPNDKTEFPAVEDGGLG